MGSPINLEDIGLVKWAPRDAHFHKESVADLLKRQSTNFPGAQPVSFARKHLKELERTDYFMAEKTDGIRCLLYLTQIQDPSNGQLIEAQFLIDRKNEYYYIKPGWLHIPPPTPPGSPEAFDIHAWHLGTLLDGELVRQRFKDGREQLTFLIFDCLAIDNVCVTTKDYGSRIYKAENGVVRPWAKFAKAWPQEAAVQPFQLEIKKPQLPYYPQNMFTEIIPKLPHGNDGLIFTCKSTAYVSGTDQHILKWKPPHENTVDFRLQLGSFPLQEDEQGPYEDFDQKPEIELLVYYGNNDYRKFAELHLTDEEWEGIRSMNQAIDWRIIECYRDATTGNWRPKLDGRFPRFRDDKEHANHHTVVDSVLESIEDAISEQNLIDAAGAIRHSWKERERKAKEQESLAKRQLQEEQKKRHEAHHQAQRTSAETKDDSRSQVKEEDDDDGPGYAD